MWAFYKSIIVNVYIVGLLIVMAEDEIRSLRERVASLEAELANLRPQGGVIRQRINEMSSEVVDSNPYSRLMALKRMGIVDNYQV